MNEARTDEQMNRLLRLDCTQAMESEMAEGSTEVKLRLTARTARHMLVRHGNGIAPFESGVVAETYLKQFAFTSDTTLPWNESKKMMMMCIHGQYANPPTNKFKPLRSSTWTCLECHLPKCHPSKSREYIPNLISASLPLGVYCYLVGAKSCTICKIGF